MLKTRQAFATLLKGILGGFCIGISSIFFLVVGSYNTEIDAPKIEHKETEIPIGSITIT